jgi:hypothetical protein
MLFLQDGNRFYKETNLQAGDYAGYDKKARCLLLWRGDEQLYFQRIKGCYDNKFLLHLADPDHEMFPLLSLIGLLFGFAVTRMESHNTMFKEIYQFI